MKNRVKPMPILTPIHEQVGNTGIYKHANMNPDSKVHGPRWAPCWPHEPCYRGTHFHEYFGNPCPFISALWYVEKCIQCFNNVGENALINVAKWHLFSTGLLHCSWTCKIIWYLSKWCQPDSCRTFHIQIFESNCHFDRNTYKTIDSSLCNMN